MVEDNTDIHRVFTEVEVLEQKLENLHKLFNTVNGHLRREVSLLQGKYSTLRLENNSLRARNAKLALKVETFKEMYSSSCLEIKFLEENSVIDTPPDMALTVRDFLKNNNFS